MNKLLEKELGERIMEKRGWHWALTNFAVEICSKNRREVEDQTESW
jgi:hypothetical protein